MATWYNTFFFGIYPYIALAVMILGSIVRYDREPYSWRSGSSQMLRKKQLFWGSNLFHIGIILLFLGHFIGLLTPHWAYAWLIDASTKQTLAVTAGGIFGGDLLRRPDAPAASPAHRSADQADQHDHGHRYSGDPLGPAGARPRSPCRSRSSTATAAR